MSMLLVMVIVVVIGMVVIMIRIVLVVVGAMMRMVVVLPSCVIEGGSVDFGGFVSGCGNEGGDGVGCDFWW